MPKHLFDKAQCLALPATEPQSAIAGGFEANPAVKPFVPDASATWTSTKLNARDPGSSFGLSDLGLGCPELPFTSSTELAAIRERHGLPVERDWYLWTGKPLSSYAAEAQVTGWVQA